MDLQIGEKRALVTGSTAGIGFAIARALAREGAHVIVNGRTSARVQDAARVIGGHVETIAADLSDPASARRVIERFPSVDILVNNLGVYNPKPFEALTDDDWRAVIETNFMSGVRLCRHYLPIMKTAGWGRILFISSESAVNIPAAMIHYGVTKTMQVALARGLAETTVGTNVTVNSVLAGPTRTEGTAAMLAGSAGEQGISAEAVEQQFFKTLRPTSLLKRFESPDEVAAMVAFLASPLSSGTNGAAVRVEGGVVSSIL